MGWAEFVAALPASFKTPAAIIAGCVFVFILVVLISGLRASHSESISVHRSRSTTALWMERGAVIVFIIVAALVYGAIRDHVATRLKRASGDICAEQHDPVHATPWPGRS